MGGVDQGSGVKRIGTVGSVCLPPAVGQTPLTRARAVRQAALARQEVRGFPPFATDAKDGVTPQPGGLGLPPQSPKARDRGHPAFAAGGLISVDCGDSAGIVEAVVNSGSVRASTWV